MNSSAAQGFSRRQLLKTAAAASVAAAGIGANILIPGRARAAKQMRILDWRHPVRAYDRWYDAFAREWGRQNDTDVTIEHVNLMVMPIREMADITAPQGHDLVFTDHPIIAHEDRVVDMSDVYQECTRRHGKPLDLAGHNTLDLRTGKHVAFCAYYTANVVHYRKDLWDEVGMVPDSWEHIRQGGAKIKRKTGHPVGIGISNNADASTSLRAILYSFGGSVQNEHGELVLDSPQSLEALKFVKALFNEAMTPAVLRWGPPSNNRLMLSGKGSLAINPISIARAAERRHSPLTDKIWLAEAPAGPAGAFMPAGVHTYGIPKSAKNVDGAKKFLVHFIDRFQEALVASEFFALPTFPGAVPDANKVLGNDERTQPPDKYALLADTSRWVVNFGYPGYVTAPNADIFNDYVVNRMFAAVAQGAQTPEEALKAADAECRRIYSKWRAKGLV